MNVQGKREEGWRCGEAAREKGEAGPREGKGEEEKRKEVNRKPA